MLEKDASELVEQYISGWEQNNLQLIISCLSENCVVIESHGPTYHGIRDIENWFKLWLEAKSKIFKWDIISFAFCEKEQTAFCEWDFSCISDNKKYSFLGLSVVKLLDCKIRLIHEYRMTNPPYEWKGDELNSE